MTPRYLQKYKTNPAIQLITEIKNKGIGSAAKAVKRVFSQNLGYIAAKTSAVFKTEKENSFVFEGKLYPYFIHRFNKTFVNERTVEISLAEKKLQEYAGKRILEVGNVLSHYFKSKHDVLDKYEVAGKVINEDIANFKAKRKYDLIISISTFEHIGFDEEDIDAKKILKVIKRLPELLKKKGEVFITVPMGYNPDLDKLINEGKISRKHISIMRRVSADNKWEEIPYFDNMKKYKPKYGKPYPNANFLAVISFFNK